MAYSEYWMPFTWHTQLNEGYTITLNGFWHHFKEKLSNNMRSVTFGIAIMACLWQTMLIRETLTHIFWSDEDQSAISGNLLWCRRTECGFIWHYALGTFSSGTCFLPELYPSLPLHHSTRSPPLTPPEHRGKQNTTSEHSAEQRGWLTTACRTDAGEREWGCGLLGDGGGGGSGRRGYRSAISTFNT